MSQILGIGSVVRFDDKRGTVTAINRQTITVTLENGRTVEIAQDTVERLLQIVR